MTREQKIEMAARAIRNEVCKRANNRKSWEEMADYAKEPWLKEAEAALVAVGAIDAFYLTDDADPDVG